MESIVMKTFKLIVMATVLAAAPACKKKPKDAPPPVVSIDAPAATGSDTGSAAAGSDTGSAAAGSDLGSAAAGSDTGSAAVAALPAEYVLVEAWHKEPKPTDPVVVHFEKFTVTKATFDPAKIEGGKATIEVDVTSLKTDAPKRDIHLKTKDYLETEKFASLVINVDNVKKKDGSTYTGDAKVKFRGVEKKYPVTFEVVEAKEDWVKIKAEHKFARTDFKVGRPVDVKDEGVAQDLVFKLQLTLKKT
ncbi:MAG: YceI family protein [Kofleriaceae bacterium]